MKSNGRLKIVKQHRKGRSKGCSLAGFVSLFWLGNGFNKNQAPCKTLMGEGGGEEKRSNL